MGSTGAQRPESAAPSADRGHSLRSVGPRGERRARSVPDFARSVARARATEALDALRARARRDEARRGPELGPSARPGVSKDVAVRNAAGRDVSEARIPEYQEHLCGVRRLALGPARGSNTRLRRSAEL